MRLAGQIRLRTFLWAAGIAVALGALVFCGGSLLLPTLGVALVSAPPPPAADQDGQPIPTTPVAPFTQTASPGPAPTTAGLRDVDQDAMAFQGRALGTEKQKDVTSGKPYKINVYQDAGQPSANRLKIDLDRDDKWDEKWTFEPGKIARQVAPADDEAYTQTFVWDGTAWIPAS